MNRSTHARPPSDSTQGSTSGPTDGSTGARSVSRPAWVNPELWPWEPRWVEGEGGRLHVIDEGPRDAPALLFVHGTPTWAFLWRHLIADLSRDHRVVAFDHQGFGLSESPEGWGYRPADHARNVGRVVETLGLGRLTLVVHDFGGPIGLGWALGQADAPIGSEDRARPEEAAGSSSRDHVGRLEGLVLFNTWCWSLAGTRAAAMSRVLGGGVGRFLYRRNFSPKVLLPAAFADKKRLDREVHRHYLEAFPTPGDRHAPWVLARELAASGAWYDELWGRRERLAAVPTLMVWGMKDPAFGPEALGRWRGALPSATVEQVDDAGHFVQEEAPKRAVRAIRHWKGVTEAG